MNDKVFISYASEDIEYTEKLFYFLQKQHLKPWLDHDFKTQKGTNEVSG